MATLTRCRYCDSCVNQDFGAEEPAAHQDATGRADDPRSPGDHNHCCDACCYGEPRKCKEGA